MYMDAASEPTSLNLMATSSAVMILLPFVIFLFVSSSKSLLYIPIPTKLSF